MSWSKLSDDFGDDCWTLSDAAFRLHVEGIVWSNRKLLDCRLPKDDVRRFKTPDAVRELVDGGWWLDVGDAYVVQHHAVYQRSRTAVLAQQAANQENGKKGGRPRRPARERHGHADQVRRDDADHEGDQQPTDVTQSVSESVTDPVSRDRAAAGNSITAERAETHSVSESKTERDRTGQVKDWLGGRDQKTNWPDVRQPGGSGPFPLCAGCFQPLAVVEAGQNRHPTCGAA